MFHFSNLGNNSNKTEFNAVTFCHKECMNVIFDKLRRTVCKFIILGLDAACTVILEYTITAG